MRKNNNPKNFGIKGKIGVLNATSLAFMLSPTAVMASGTNGLEDSVVEETIVDDSVDLVLKETEETEEATETPEDEVEVEDKTEEDKAEEGKTEEGKDDSNIEYTDEDNSVDYKDEDDEDKVVVDDENDDDKEKVDEGELEQPDKEVVNEDELEQPDKEVVDKEDEDSEDDEDAEAEGEDKEDEDAEAEDGDKEGSLEEEEEEEDITYEILTNDEFVLELDPEKEIDATKPFKGEKLVAKLSNGVEIDLLKGLKGEELEEEFELLGISVDRFVVNHETKRKVSKIAPGSTGDYEIMYKVVMKGNKDKDFGRVLKILEKYLIETTDIVGTANERYTVERSDLAKDIKEVRVEDLISKFIVEGKEIDLKEVEIDFSKAETGVLTLKHDLFKKDLVFDILSEEEVKLELEVAETIDINMNKDVDEEALKDVIKKATIAGKDAKADVVITHNMPSKKEDFNKKKDYVITSKLEYKVDGKVVSVKTAETKVKLQDHGIVLKVEKEVDLDFGEKIKNDDLKDFIIKATIDGKDATKDVDIEHDININKDGRYTITYTLKDKDGNVVEEETRVYITDDIEFDVPSKITIEKNDKRFDPPTDDVVAKKGEKDYVNKLKITHNVNPSKVGTYRIDYTLTIGEYQRTKTTRVEVVEGPEFIVPEQIVVQKGDRFTPSTEGVIAKISGRDYRDSIKFTHNVDTNRVGEYELKYTLRHDGETYERTSKVLVVDGVSFEVDKMAVVEYGGRFDPLSYVSKAKIGNVDALDRVDVQHDVDTEVPGKYEVLYTMDLGNGNVYKKTLTLTVLEPGETVLEDSEEAQAKPDGEDYEDYDEYEYEYVDGDEEVVEEIVKTGESLSNGFNALRATFASMPVIGVTLGSYKNRKKRD